MQTHYWTHNKWKLYWIKIGERPTVILSGFSHVLTLREFREIVAYVSLCVCVYFHFSPSELSYLSVGNICFISLCVFLSPVASQRVCVRAAGQNIETLI